jgi:hypothetical protein
VDATSLVVVEQQPWRTAGAIPCIGETLQRANVGDDTCIEEPTKLVAKADVSRASVSLRSSTNSSVVAKLRSLPTYVQLVNYRGVECRNGNDGSRRPTVAILRNPG